MPLDEESQLDDASPFPDGKPPPGSFDLPVPPRGLSEAVWASTARALRRRRGRRRALISIGLAGLYAVGLGTGLLWRRSHPISEEPIPAGAPVPARDFAPAPAPVAAPAPADLTRATDGDDPRALLGKVSSAAPEERLRLLRRAGDACLARLGDLEGALHCYRQLLELQPADARAGPEPEDSWLLAALKQGQR